MPCHSAHAWYDEVVARCSVPFLHIVDAAREAIGERRTVGILAAPATLQTRLYPERLGREGILCLEPLDMEPILAAIARVKVGDHRGAAERLAGPIADQLDRGAEVVVLACTELPLALPHLPAELAAACVDPTEALARACVRWAMAQR